MQEIAVINAYNSGLDQYVSTSLVEIVANTIRSNIYNGLYRPGQKLIVRELSESLGVSNTPIKEALNRLVSEGYVEAPPRKSMIVKEFSIAGLMENLQIRLVLELSSVDDILLAARDNPLLLETMEREYEKMAACLHEDGLLDYQTWIACETSFHRAYMNLCGNGKLAEMYGSLDSNKNCYFTYLYVENTPLTNKIYKKYMPEHRRIIDAISGRKKEELVRAISDHIRTVATHYVTGDGNPVLDRIDRYTEIFLFGIRGTGQKEEDLS